MSPLSKFVGFGVALGLVLSSAVLIGHRKAAGTSKPPIQTTAHSAAKFPGAVDRTAKARVVESYGKLPLSFEVNQGQASNQVKFLTRGLGYILFLAGKEAVLSMTTGKSGASSLKAEDRELSLLKSPRRATEKEQTTTDVLRMKLAGASKTVEPVGMDELPGKSNYFIGNDPKKWRSNIPTYAKVRYKNVYPGIDLVYYGDQGQLEYDFVVAPGADPGLIALAFEDWTDNQRVGLLRIDKKTGDVIVESGSSVVHVKKPVIYQRKNFSARAKAELSPQDSRPVDGGFVLTASNQIRFELGPYDKSQPLVIDPALTYSTFLGGTVANSSADSFSVAVDPSGNTFILGGDSPPFPITNGAFEMTPAPRYVAEINPTATAVVYATYLGATSGETALCGEFQGGLALDSSDNVYVTGYTTSTTFPVTAGAFQTKLANPQGCNAFATKLNSTGSALVYSTYLGGTNGADIGQGIAVDTSGNAYVAGLAGSSDFPTTPGAFQEVNHGGASQGISGDGFLTELKPDGSGLVFATFLGGSGGDIAASVALDSAGAIYVSGTTGSPDFPTRNPLQGTFKGTLNAFITKFAPGGSSLDYSTYLGGSGTDYGAGLVVDGLGNAYVGGETSSANFPTANPFQPACPTSGSCVFAAKINSTGSALIYSTYLGGSASQGQTGRVFAVDASGNVYLSGQTWSSDFPLLNPIQTTFGGNVDDFVTVLDPAGTALVFSTYLGGSGRDRMGRVALDSAGHVHVAGVTESTDFPVLPGAMQASFSGGSAAFISKIDLSANANPDYLLLPAPNSISLAPGATGKFNINVMPLGGFNQAVSINCTGAPSKSTCTPSPSSVTLDGAHTAGVTVKITTTASRAAFLRTPKFSLFAVAAFTLPLGFMVLCLESISRRTVTRRGLLVLALVVAWLAFLVSCGGGGGSGNGGGGGGGSTGTSPGTYTLTVTGTSGNLSHPTTVSLTVN